MVSETDKLLDDASRGDPAAARHLLEQLQPDLEKYVRAHAGELLRERESTSDLVQSVCRETLQRLVSDGFRFQGESEFRHWLFQAALFKIRKRRRFYRAAKRDARCEATLSGAERANAFFRTLGTPSRAAMAREELDRVRAAYDCLPERYREIIALAHFDGLAHAEIARHLKISETNSRVVLSRAIARLVTLADPS